MKGVNVVVVIRIVFTTVRILTLEPKFEITNNLQLDVA